VCSDAGTDPLFHLVSAASASFSGKSSPAAGLYEAPCGHPRISLLMCSVRLASCSDALLRMAGKLL